jgi:hypothetical protein
MSHHIRLEIQLTVILTLQQMLLPRVALSQNLISLCGGKYLVVGLQLLDRSAQLLDLAQQASRILLLMGQLLLTLLELVVERLYG